MAMMVSIAEQLIHSMKKMRLSVSSLVSAGCINDGVHLILDEEPASSPKRKYAIVGSGSNKDHPQDTRISQKAPSKLQQDSFEQAKLVPLMNSVMDSSECDTPVLDGMLLSICRADRSNM